MTATTGVDAGDGLPLTVPGAAARPRRGARRTPCCSCATTTCSPTPRPTAARPRWPAACSPSAPARARRVGLLHPNGPDVRRRLARRGPHRRRRACRSAPSRPPPSWPACCAAPTSRCCSAPASYRSHDYAATLRAGRPRARPRAPRRRCSRRRAGAAPHRVRRRADAGVDAGWTTARRSSPPGRRSTPDVLAAAEADGHAGRPARDRAHVGLDQRAQGRDPHPRRADPPPRQPQPDPPLHARTRCCSRTRRSSGSAGSPTALLGTLVAGARSCARTPPTPADVLDVLERERPTMVNGFAPVGRPPARATRASPAATCRSIRRGNLCPIMPDDVRPADPELRHAMLGMTETGSVCLASDDEGDQPEHRRGLVRPPRARASRPAIVDPDTRRDVRAGRAGRAVVPRARS